MNEESFKFTSWLKPVNLENETGFVIYSLNFGEPIPDDEFEKMLYEE